MAREDGENADQLPAIGNAERPEELALCELDRFVQPFEKYETGGRDLQALAAGICGIRGAVHEPLPVEGDDDRRDVFAVEAESTADFCLTDGPELLKRSEQRVGGSRSAEFSRVASDDSRGSRRRAVQEPTRQRAHPCGCVAVVHAATLDDLPDLNYCWYIQRWMYQRFFDTKGTIMTDDLTRLLPRIYTALDEHRFDDLPAFYTPNVTAVTPGGKLSGHAELVAQASRNHDDSHGLQHLVSTVLIEDDGDSATLRANLVAIFSGSDRTPVFELGSVWRGRAQRDGDTWRISEFAITPLWQRGVRPAA